MPKTKNATQRLQLIDEALQRETHPSMQDLQRKILDVLGESVSSETIQKDISCLKKEHGAEIYYSRSRGGYSYKKKGTSLFAKVLDETASNELKAAASLLAQYKSSPILAPVQMAVEKLMLFLNLHQDSGPDQAALIPDDTPIARGTEHLPKLLDAIRRKHAVRFPYYAASEDRFMELTVSPWLLKEYDGRWYLIGAETGRHHPRLYGLDRIEGVIEPSFSDATTPPAGLASMFSHVVGVSEFYKEPEIIHVFFEKKQAWYVRTKPIHHSQNELVTTASGSTFRYHVVRNWEFEADVRRNLGQIAHGSFVHPTTKNPAVPHKPDERSR